MEKDIKVMWKEYCKKAAMLWTLCYSFVLFAVFPLYYDNSYVNILRAKTSFFVIGTAVYLAGCGLLAILAAGSAKRHTYTSAGIKGQAGWSDRISLSATDICCLCFVGSVLLSTLLGEDKADMCWGTSGRLFGTAVILLCAGLYVCFSRFFPVPDFLPVIPVNPEKDAPTGKRSFLRYIFVISCLAGTSVVSVLVILNCFGADPLQMYGAIDPAYIPFYMSTIGQINITAAFLCIFLPLFTGVYLFSDRVWMRILCEAGTVLVLAAGVCTNSDSFFLAIGITVLFYMAVSFKDQEKLSDCLLLFGAAAFGMALMKIGNAETGTVAWGILQQIWLDMPWLIVGAALLLASLLLKKKGRIAGDTLKKGRKLWIFFWAGVLAVLLIYIIAVNLLRPDADHAIAGSLTIFDDHWGNNRGYVWTRTVESFTQLPLIQQIFGVGPGQFPDFFAAYYEDSIQKLGGYFADAHSEYLQYLVMTGAAGMLSYIGMIVCSVRACLKRRLAVGYVLAAVLLVWMAQGAVNNPVTFTEPYLFVFMGIAQRPWKA